MPRYPWEDGFETIYENIVFLRVFDADFWCIWVFGHGEHESDVFIKSIPNLNLHIYKLNAFIIVFLHIHSNINKSL
jgi:hypothetical protein